jgi:predicted DNA-binding protein (UPF0251 family)
MPRPKCARRVALTTGTIYFKPRGIPLADLEEEILTLDELEALRLADLEGLYQDQAAEKMNISRPTFGRIIETAHRKVAGALVHKKALRIEGGVIEMEQQRLFRCSDCGHSWSVAYGTGRPGQCPQCQSANLHRAEEDRGHSRGGRRGGGCGRRGGRWQN